MSAQTFPLLSIPLATEEATAALGVWLGAHLVAGDVVLLSGPIGAGKTHLARALIRSRLGDARAEVPSPTFTLVQTYDAPDVVIWHADLYRIGRPDEVIELGLDGAFQDAVVLVEWPERLGRWRPVNPISIDLVPLGETRLARIDTGARPELSAALRKDWHARDD